MIDDLPKNRKYRELMEAKVKKGKCIKINKKVNTGNKIVMEIIYKQAEGNHQFVVPSPHGPAFRQTTTYYHHLSE